MEQTMHKFPSIEQFRNVIQQVTHRARYRGEDEDGQPIYEDCELPTLKFKGTIKLHGSNAGIVYTYDHLNVNYAVHAQSRSRILTPTSDNAGFAAFLHTRSTTKLLSKLMMAVSRESGEDGLGYTPETVKVFGEWCGGNIQKGVAINGLDKMFVIFGIKIDNMWVSDEVLSQVKNEEENIYNILDYPTYEVDIDFNNPKVAAEIMSKMTEDVEKECPVGKAFGNEGIGEGIVWRCVEEGFKRSRYWFKTKGDKHKSSGTKEKVPVDVERVNSMNELVNVLVTESRLKQGFDYLKEHGKPFDRSSTGPYLKWLYDDVIKEELDTIMENGFEPKEISGAISNKGRKYFFEEIDNGIGL
jgi:hypothetical protein